MNSLHSFGVSQLRRTVAAFLFVSVLIWLTPLSAPAQELYDFNSLAADTARAIEKASHGSGRTVILVTDFSEKSAPESELGIALARDFANALRSRAQGIIVLDRSDLESSISSHKLPEGALVSPRIAGCYASDLEATVIISASIEYAPDKIVLDLSASSAQRDEGIFSDQVIINRTPAMEELMIKPAPKVAASYGDDKTTWVKDEESTAKELPPSSGTKGNSYPSCVVCRQADYSDAAVKAKVQGTIVLKVVVGADGRAEKISVQQALPCGLDQQAINAVKNWKFKPATGPDGNPATVLQTVEVTFHLY
ncbi:MAG: energy transducer TonB [Candidatus Acidiferrales bacterium]